MGSYASHQPKKVFPTVCERSTSPNLLECIDAHDLLRMSPVADPSISQADRDSATSPAHSKVSPTLPPCLSLCGSTVEHHPCHAKPSVPISHRSCPTHIFSGGPLFGICLASLWTANSCQVLMCVGARNVRRPAFVLMPVADSIRHWPERARLPTRPAPYCLYQICI